MSREKERVNAYLATLARMEPDVTLVDRDAALASLAISTKRLADSLEAMLCLLQAEVEGKR